MEGQTHTFMWISKNNKRGTLRPQTLVEQNGNTKPKSVNHAFDRSKISFRR